jgi:hypothetical protein
MNIFPKVNCYKENIVIWNNVIWDVFMGKFDGTEKNIAMKRISLYGILL